METLSIKGNMVCHLNEGTITTTNHKEVQSKSRQSKHPFGASLGFQTSQDSVTSGMQIYTCIYEDTFYGMQTNCQTLL